jgi:hypothetical protein
MSRFPTTLAAACAALLAAAPAFSDDAPRAPKAAPSMASLDDAMAEIAAAATRAAAGREARLRLVVEPLEAQGSALAGLITRRAVERLRETPVRLIDPSFAEVLLRAQLKADGPALGPGRVAELLGCDAALAGSVVELRGHYVVALRLVEAGEGRELAAASVEIEKAAAEGLAAAGATSDSEPKGGPLGCPGEEPIVVDRAVVLEHALEGGGFTAPEIWKAGRVRIGDRIQLWIRPQQRCLIQVLVKESSGAFRRLYPPGKEPVLVAAGTVIKLPEEKKLWYRLIPPGGKDEYYILAESESVASGPASLANVGMSIAPAEKEPGPAPAAGGREKDAPAPRAAPPASPAPEEKPPAKSEARDPIWAAEQQAFEAEAQRTAVVNRALHAERLLAQGGDVDVRALSEPEPGDDVEVSFDKGKADLVLPRVRGYGRVVERLTVESR